VFSPEPGEMRGQDGAFCVYLVLAMARSCSSLELGLASRTTKRHTGGGAASPTATSPKVNEAVGLVDAAVTFWETLVEQAEQDEKTNPAMSWVVLRFYPHVQDLKAFKKELVTGKARIPEGEGALFTKWNEDLDQATAKDEHRFYAAKVALKRMRSNV